MDNVWPDHGLDRSNSCLAVHFDQSFLDANIYHIFHIVVTLMRFALQRCNDFFFLWLFLLLCAKPFKEKECCNKFHVVMKRNKAKQQQTELWSNTSMQQDVLYVLLCCDQ